jgi:predicted outer membrane repeat protein
MTSLPDSQSVHKHSLPRSLAFLPLTILFGLLPLALLMLLLTPRVAYAGGVVGNGTPGSCTEAALNAALAGGGSVTFNCGASPVTITLTSQKLINSSTNINGGGLITLSGGGTTRIFTTTSGVNLTLSNLTLRNGAATGIGTQGDGGAIYNTSGTLNLTSVNFLNNTASRDGGAIIASGTVNISNTTFLNNTASDDGGAFQTQATTLLTNSTVSGNSASDRGGGIYNSGGTLTIVSSTISGNVASGPGEGFGGGLYNIATIVITSTQLVNNRSAFDGGALLNAISATATINNSTFTLNLSQDDGGAIFNEGSGSVTNSTLSGNSSNDSGGAVRNDGTSLTLSHVTVYNNTSSALGGGGIYNQGSVTVSNSMVAASPTGGNCVSTGVFTGQGNNLDTDGTCVALSAAFAQTTTPALNLGALGNNGGRTQTHALSAGSAAINTGSNAFCPSIDQRGATRPVNTTCDIGAYEFGAAPTLTSLNPSSASVFGPTFTLTVNGTKFIPGSVVLWNGSARTTTFVSGSVLTTTIPASDLNSAGAATVQVRYGDALESLSNSLPFAITKASQTITFGPLPNKTYGDPPFTVSATASSGLPVTFTSTGPCTVSGNSVTLTGAGSCTITAQQSGDGNYNPAPSVAQTFTINPAPGNIIRIYLPIIIK